MCYHHCYFIMTLFLYLNIYSKTLKLALIIIVYILH